MAIHNLTVHKVATAGSGKCKEGYGPRMDVSESGARNWVLRHPLHGRRREVGFKGFPSVGLAEAGTSAVKCRGPVAKSVAPIEARRLEAKRIPVFTRCAALNIRGHRHRRQSAKHARNLVSILKTHARPVIGEKPVNAITSEDILQILSPIRVTKTETAKREPGITVQRQGLQRIVPIWDYTPTRYASHRPSYAESLP